MSATDHDQDDHSIPTEEIYLELSELEALADETPADPDAPSPAVSEDDPSNIRARIARLRAMLNDRGATPEG